MICTLIMPKVPVLGIVKTELRAGITRCASFSEELKDAETYFETDEL